MLILLVSFRVRAYDAVAYFIKAGFSGPLGQRNRLMYSCWQSSSHAQVSGASEFDLGGYRRVNAPRPFLFAETCVPMQVWAGRMGMTANGGRYRTMAGRGRRGLRKSLCQWFQQGSRGFLAGRVHLEFCRPLPRRLQSPNVQNRHAWETLFGARPATGELLYFI